MIVITLGVITITFQYFQIVIQHMFVWKRFLPHLDRCLYLSFLFGAGGLLFCPKMKESFEDDEIASFYRLKNSKQFEKNSNFLRGKLTRCELK